MNILPHKSWHVRTKKNIERVRKDEEKAAEEEKEKQRKIALAEQEARTELLRSRARGKLIEGKASSSQPYLHNNNDHSEVGTSADPDRSLVSSQSEKTVSVPGLGNNKEHINFFKDIEDGLTKQGKNKEYEAEKKKEQEDLEKKIGLLTYLGQTALDEKKTAPWYLKKFKERKRKRSDTGSESDEEKALESKLKLAVQEKRRESLDPLIEMKEFLHKKKHKHSHKKKSKNKDKKHKKESRPRLSKTEASSSKIESHQVKSTSAQKTVEQMRAERLARERQEKQRTLALINRSKDGKVAKDSSSESDDDRQTQSSGKRKYNSQYNPEFIPESKPKRHRRDNFF